MKTLLAIVCFGLSFTAFIIGFVTEYRQSHGERRKSRVPTLPWAAFAAIFIVLGLVWLPYAIPLWVFPLALLGSAAVFGFLITKASTRPTDQSDT